ncbi:hypothetical protein KUW00_07635 [Halomonas sp. DP5N14-9]|uniref:hypothetical protein n=1 Tax=Halomonas sp. DP5N14-9 TaxID=2859075 RepID=UPI001C9925B4|nr:hypothetical protein [Halomonas sp. DP5N14-9]MBY5940758.1 hypothetical protein [Halomonas sp. DP5N14-9]|tara:strand:- start:149 stop:496 length:348 start_codon:yes stop_codon:yes gene_type:complete
MNKAVEIDMTFEEDPGETIRLVAVVNDRGDLTSTQVYGFARDRAEEELVTYPFVLDRAGDDHYQIRWGYGDCTESALNFSSPAVALGQRVYRVDTYRTGSARFCYEITGTNDLVR